MFFAESRAVEITTERISDYIHSRQKDGAANASINRELAALKRMFRLGERAGKVAPFLATEKNAADGTISFWTPNAP